MSILKVELERVAKISFEFAHEEIAKMTHVERMIGDGVEVVSGAHPEHGNIHVILPPAGDAFLLYPFVIRQY